MDGMPDDLQYLPEDKQREPDPKLRLMLLETLTQACCQIAHDGHDLLYTDPKLRLMAYYLKVSAPSRVVECPYMSSIPLYLPSQGQPCRRPV
jgi:hypothetical protein